MTIDNIDNDPAGNNARWQDSNRKRMTPKYDLSSVPLDEMVKEIARRSHYPNSGIRYHGVDHRDETWDVRRHGVIVSSGKGVAEILVVHP